jgi:electron transfer flavoprotein beta subunit
LKFSQLTLVDKIFEIDQKKKIIRVRRKLDDQYETVESTFPALITVVRETNVPRYPTVPGRLDAAERGIPVWTNDMLKLDPRMVGLKGSPTQVRRIFAPHREKGEIIHGEGHDKQQAVETLIEKLVHWNFVSLEQ